MELVNIDILFWNVGNIVQELKYYRVQRELSRKVKRSNCKNPLPRKFRNIISKLRCRIQITFYQLNECFNSKIGLQTSLQIKILCFNIMSIIGGHTRISKTIKFN